MTQELKESLIIAAKVGTLYDWLQQHYHEMSQYEIFVLAKELAYCVESTNSKCGYSHPVLTDSINDLVQEIDCQIEVY